MNTHELIPLPSIALDAEAPGVSNKPRLRNRARLSGLPALLLLCLGCFLLPFRVGAQPLPVVTFSGVPSQVPIGDDFTFIVNFRNAAPALPINTGFGPFLDVVLEEGGADNCAACGLGLPDGLTFVSATLLTGGPIPLTELPLGGAHTPCPHSSGIAFLPHPLAVPYGSPLSGVIVPYAGSLSTLELPLSQYAASQPDLQIAVRVHVSDRADANIPLRICVRGGFKLGKTPVSTDNATDLPILSTDYLGLFGQNDTIAWATECFTVTPTVLTLSKGYSGPEGEAATGPNYLNYYPLTYTLNVDIADKQKINNLIVQDCLPPTLVYQNTVQVWIHGVLKAAGVDYVLTKQPVQTAPQNPPLNILEIDFSNSNPITGTTAPNDVSITFQFYIPKKDANNNDILPPGCSSIITNVVKAMCDWTPNDPCDLPGATIVAGPVEHTITAKCLAVQKSVRFAQPGDYLGAVSGDLNFPGATPDDLLRYEIRFQVSDYKTIGRLVLTDCLSDGQYLEWNSAPWPQLTVTDQFGTLTADFDASNYGADWTVDFDTNCPCNRPAGLSANRFTFDISQLMMDQAPTHPRHDAGILTGGWASTPTSTTPATGKLVFYVKIYDAFFYWDQNDVPGVQDQYLDKHDPLFNCVVVEGELFQNVAVPLTVPTMPTGNIASDDSGTALSIVGAPFEKTVYAVNNSTTWPGFPNPPCLAPGDTVTFRLKKTFPSGDAEDVVVTDSPPLPVLNVTDPLGSGSSSIWLGQSTVVPPPTGYWSLGSSTHTVPGVPTFSSSTPNEITFAIGSFNNPFNTPLVMDIYFTMTIRSDPFADGLVLNNEAVECEDNTLTSNQPFCQVDLAEIKIVEPNLRITKGVVATSNPNGVFMPFPPGLTGQPTFTAPGSACPRFTPTVSSTAINPALGGVPVVSDLWCAKPGDRVTFAIIAENLGQSPKGAFDIIIKDSLDPHCFANVGNLCVRRGDGTTFTTTGNLFGGGLAFADGVIGALEKYDALNGKNIMVITFDATFTSGPASECCTNKIEVVNYSNVEGGANFVTAGFGAQLGDTAQVCTTCCHDLSITKTAMGAFMAGLNGTYMITVMNNGCGPVGAPVTVTDTLPAGLTPVSVAGNDWACSINGQTITCNYIGTGSIPPGGSFPPITVSVSIPVSAGGTTPVNCADVQSPNDNNPANNHACVSVDVLTNRCFAITNESITCSSNGTYVFEFDLVNLSGFPVAQVSFVMESPYGVSVSPDPFLFGTPVNPGGIGHIKVAITGPGCGKVCFLMSIHDQLGVNCCTPDVGIKKCLVLPECPCVPAPFGMVGWWRGDNTPTDSTGLGNNGAWVGNPNYGFGEVGQAFSVANAGDYVSVPTAASLDFLATDSFSIDAWVRTVNNGIAAIVDKRDVSGFPTVVGYELLLNNGRLHLQLNGLNYINSSSPMINDGEWQHVTAVVDRSIPQVRLYVNATLVHSAPVVPNVSVANNRDLRIGQDRFLNASFNGQIDEVEIFNRALTAAEIKSLWVAGCAGKCKCVAPPPGLTNWWRFDVKVGSTVFDSAGLILNNGTTSGTLQPGKVGNALCFNGVNQWMQVANNSEVQFTGTCPGGSAQSLTIDCWIKTTQAGTVANPTTILDKRTSFFGPRGYTAALVNGRPSFTMADGVNHTYTVTTGPSLADGKWHYIAITYERCANNMLKFYVDGNFTPVATFFTGPLGSLSAGNNAALRVGRRSTGFGNNYFYLGCIDELEFFKRALTDLEIFSIWNAGSAGKCRPGQPAIGQAPINQWSKAGSNAVFNVVALSEDNDPLSYQWLFNGAPIADGTNDTLTVFNAQPASVGAYSVVVANGFGSVTSTPATLTVVGSNICTLLIQSGDNLWANQLNNGDNKLALLIPDAPEGSQVFQYDNVTDAFRIATFSFGSWDNEITLNPGGGAILRNSGEPFTLTLTGTPVLPALPRALSTGYNLVARPDLGPGTFGNTVGSPPTEGTVVYQFNPSIGGDASDLESAGFRSYAFIGGTWESEYEALPGESVVIVAPILTDVIPPVLVTASASCSNNTVTVLFSELLEAASAESPFNYSLNGPTILGGMLRLDGKTVDLNISPLQNGIPYTLTVDDVRDLAGNSIAANSQITISCSASNLPPQTIVAGVTGGKLMFNWSGHAVLQQANDPAGPWTNVVGASSGYMTTTTNAAQMFYRLNYQ